MTRPVRGRQSRTPPPGSAALAARQARCTNSPRAVRLPCLPAAGRLARGGGHRQPPFLPRRTLLGAARSGLGSARPGCCHRGPRARGARGGNRTSRSSPGTAAGTPSSPRCTGAAGRKGRTASRGRRAAAARRADAAAVRCAPPENKPTRRSGTRARRGFTRNFAQGRPPANNRVPGRISPGRRYGQCWTSADSRSRGRGRGSVTAPRSG